MGAGPLVERDQEVALIRDSMAGALRGNGQLVLVEGAPGIGKSRLLDVARGLAEDKDVAVLSARASELGREVPFELTRQLLGPGVEPPQGDVADGVDRGPDLTAWFLDALLGRIHPPSGRGANLLLVDDAQWADQASLRVLSHLVLRLDELPLLMLVALRPGRGGDDELLTGLRADPRAQRIALDMLSSAGVEEVVSAACGDSSDAQIVAACERASGGNPFYLVELLGELNRSAGVTAEAISDAAPATVLAAIMARLGRAGQQATALASAVAVLDASPSLKVAAELAELELPTAELVADELVRAHILAADEPVRLAHPLIASTLRSDIGPFARARMHGRAAELLAANGAGDDRVAAHLLLAPAEGDASTVERLRRAAAMARGRGEPAIAARLLKRALAEPPDDAVRGEVLLSLGEVEAMDGSPDALATLEEALGVVDADRRVEATIALARTLHHAGRFGEAADLAEAARRELAADDARQHMLLGAWFSSAMLHAPLHPRIADEISDITDQVRRGDLPDDPTLSALLASWLNRADVPVELVRALAEHAFEQDPLVDGDSRGAALGYAAVVLVCVDAPATVGLLEAAVGAGQERGASIAVAIGRHFLAHAHLHAGRLDQAVTEAELSLEVYRHGWTESAWSTPVLTMAQLDRGDLDAAAEAIAIGDTADPPGAERAMLLEARAELRIAQGDPAAALQDALGAGSVADTFGVRSTRLFGWPRVAARAAHACGEFEEAQRLATDAVERAREDGVARQLAAALTAYGTILGEEAGLQALDEAVEVLDKSPARLQRAHTHLARGRLLRRTGKRSTAREDLYGALELGDAMGALPIVHAAREELRALGLRPRRAARTGVESLTPSERRVAELVAEGNATAQVATELYVTRKTVESHLTQIYRKLNITRRGELAAALAEDAVEDRVA
jgi:DNA-binding CsgD family transcriptional regulator